MPASRNPFYIRTAEQAESDDQFLNLFSLSVLDLLPDDGSWNRFLPIEGAPGSGKSTLLRLFTPTVLTSIQSARSHPELRDLVQKLRNIDAIDPSGVQVLGVLVNCKEDYSRLADLRLDPSGHEALFKALLNSRLALLTIRAALQFAGRSYPSEVDVVKFEPRNDSSLSRPDARVISGRELFERARAVEETIVNSLNSFAPRAPSSPEALFTDDFFQVLSSHRLLLDQRDAPRHMLIMFDDAHMLDSSQRAWLTRELERHDRTGFASWMAMRLRALEPQDLITEAVRADRERFKPVQFERWRSAKIETWLTDVGDRRARRAQRDVSSFAACLADSLDSEFDQQRLAAVATGERDRAFELAQPYGDFYRDWLAQTDGEIRHLAPYEQAVRWAQLQILMERRIRRIQGEFNFDSLPPVDLDRAGSGTAEPAALFVSSRNVLPYFYGVRRVAQLASTNVEQFLSLSGALFDRLLNSGRLGRRSRRQLFPSEQDRLILTKSRAFIADLKTSLPYGQDVSNLVTAIAELCRQESHRPNVPITPGVTGVSILVSERNVLISEAKVSGGMAARLLNALASAVAHNVLLIRDTDRQRDEDRVVIYLNRLMCPAYDLPLGFGGYKPQKLSRLSAWVVTGQHSPQRRLSVG